MGCASLQTQTAPCPFCEVLSGRICLVNGTQVSGWGGGMCARLTRGLCLFSLCNGPQPSAANQPEPIGSQWAGVKAHPPFSPLMWDRDVGGLVKNLIMKFKASHSTMSGLRDEQN